MWAAKTVTETYNFVRIVNFLLELHQNPAGVSMPPSLVPFLRIYHE